MKTLPKSILTFLLLSFLFSCTKDNSSCGNEESITWFVNDETHQENFDDIHVFLADERMLKIAASPSVETAETGFVIYYDLLKESAHYGAGGISLDGNYISTHGENLQMSVSSFSSVGDLICLNFDNGEFSGELIVKLDKIVKSGTVVGTVWEDENMNGLREPDESLLVNEHIRVAVTPDVENLNEDDPSYDPYYYPSDSIKTTEFGEFIIKGVFVDYPIKLRFYTYDDYEVSPANKGMDDTIDSDFYVSRELYLAKWFDTDGYIVPEGSSIEHLGLGLRKK